MVKDGEDQYGLQTWKIQAKLFKMPKLLRDTDSFSQLPYLAS